MKIVKTAATPTVERPTSSPTEIICLPYSNRINNCCEIGHKLSEPIFNHVLTKFSDDNLALRRNKPIL